MDAARRFLLAPNAPGRRAQAPGAMVLLVDEPLRGDVVDYVREAQAAGEGQGGGDGRPAGGGRPPRGVTQALWPPSGLQVLALGLAGSDVEQLRPWGPGAGPVQTFSAADDGPALDRAVSGLAAALCQAASAAQVWGAPGGPGVERRGLVALGRPA